MKGKSVKLIIGIILLIVAVVLGLLNVLNSWLCLAIAVVGLIFVIFSFRAKEKNLPAVSSEPVKEAEILAPEEPSEPIDIEGNK